MVVPLNVTEWMKGFVGFGETDPAAGFAQGMAEGTGFDHEVRIAIDDIDRFVAEPTHTASLTGHVDCPRLGGVCPLAPSSVFNMFVDGSDPAIKYMFYREQFDTHDGRTFTLLGHKTLHDDRGFDLWSDITTLEVRLFAGVVAGPDTTTPALPAPPLPTDSVAAGILHILALDNIRSVLSFRTSAGILHLPHAVRKFCGLYGRSLWDVYVRHHPSAKT